MNGENVHTAYELEPKQIITNNTENHFDFIAIRTKWQRDELQ